MKVIVVANVEQQEEIISKITNPEAKLVFVKSFSESGVHENYDAFFFLTGYTGDSGMEAFCGKPVFINSVMETLEQKNALGEMGCDNWQGYLNSRPLTADAFEQRFLADVTQA